jgi:cell division transport system ATP-binding protein
MYGYKRKDIRNATIKALENVGLKDKLRSYPDELSGGEQQRVSIARAIVNDPKVLICDEPTGNLDAETSLEVMKVIEEINRKLGTTIIMATHDNEIVRKMKKRVVVIEKGLVKKDNQKGKIISESV